MARPCLLPGLALVAVTLAVAAGIRHGFVIREASSRADGTQPANARLTEALARPSFSRPGGFYTEAFDLEVSVPVQDAEIHFTVDGTEPTASSPRYLKPLRIDNRAGTRNTISAIPTIHGGPTPIAEVFKGWAVRARALKPGGEPSAITTATFWIDPRGRARYSLPVVSLVTAPTNFFDARTGIYVPGRGGKENYNRRAPKWKRPVHVEFYETNNACAFSQDAQVKIHGNTSQSLPIKGLDIDGTGAGDRQPFRYRIFPDRQRTEFKHFLLRPSGQDQQVAFMRDELCESLAAEAGLETQAARACLVFINGEYWGLNYLKEKEDVEFIRAAAARPEKGIDFLEGYVMAKAGDVGQFQSLVEYIRGHELRAPDAYAHVRRTMDVANYINYKVCEIFSYRWDMAHHRLWRPRTAEGRWRWLLFDSDVAWGGFWSQQPAWRANMLAADLATDGSLNGHNTEETTFLLRHLADSAEFRRDFINRFQDLLNTTFQPSNTLARINQLAAVLAPEMEEHIGRWRAPASLAEWERNVQALRIYGLSRPHYAREQLRQQFGLKSPVTLVLGVSPDQAGAIRLNTLWIRSSAAAPWSGQYFKGHPISLEAQPSPGYKFQSWEGWTNSQASRLTLSLDGALAIMARFAPDSAGPATH